MLETRGGRWMRCFKWAYLYNCICIRIYEYILYIWIYLIIESDKDVDCHPLCLEWYQGFRTPATDYFVTSETTPEAGKLATDFPTGYCKGFGGPSLIFHESDRYLKPTPCWYVKTCGTRISPKPTILCWDLSTDIWRSWYTVVPLMDDINTLWLFNVAMENQHV